MNEKSLKLSAYLDIFNLLTTIALTIFALVPLVFCVSFFNSFQLFLSVNWPIMIVMSVILLVLLSGNLILRALLRANAPHRFILKEYVINHIEYILLAVALFWTLISCFLQKSRLYDVVFLGNTYNKEGFLMVLIYAVFFLAALSIESAKYKHVLLITFITASALIKLALIVASVSDLTSLAIISRLKNGAFNNSNHYGYYTALATIISAGYTLHSKQSWQSALAAITLALNLLAVLGSNTLGSNIAVLMGLIFISITFFLTGRRFNYRFVLMWGVAIFVFSVSELSNLSTIRLSYYSLFGDVSTVSQDASGDAALNAGSGRWALWTGSIDTITKKPFFGKGLDCYYINDLVNGLDMPHNEFIQIAANVGLPVAILYVAAILIVYFRALKRRKTIDNTSLICLCGAFAYLVSAFFGNTFHYTYPYFLIIFAFGIPKAGKWNLSQEKVSA